MSQLKLSIPWSLILYALINWETLLLPTEKRNVSDEDGRCNNLWTEQLVAKYIFNNMSIYQSSRNRFFPKTYPLLPTTGYWLKYWCHVWVSACGMGLKSHQKVVGFFHDISATTALVVMSSQVYAHMNHSWVKLMILFSLRETLSRNEVSMSIPAWFLHVLYSGVW